MLLTQQSVRAASAGAGVLVAEATNSRSYDLAATACICSYLAQRRSRKTSARTDCGIVMLHCLPAGLTWQGREHSGLDDALNTARLAIKLMGQGAVFEVTQTSENVPVGPSRAISAEVVVAPAQGSNNTSASSGQNRTSMQALAAAKGVVGLFDSAGRWTGRCFCKVKAHFRTTKRPGPNHGRQFYSCGRWRITQQSEQCAFFLWKEDVPNGSVAPG